MSRHAYACSREHFADVLAILETLGHARLETVRPQQGANWGAELLDASATASAPYTMLCVDLAAHERTLSGAEAGLSPLTWLGPPGMWCGLHGESLLEAGLCCVSAAYDLSALSREGAFSADADCDRARLRICLHGEHQAVDPRRVASLERARYIDRPHAEMHSLHGAVGAQFEALQRIGAGHMPTPSDFARDVCIHPNRARVPGGASRRRRLRVKQLI